MMMHTKSLREMSRVGFGCYRVSADSATHREALSRALDLGCSLIDTACNYENGNSELLIRRVLESRDRGNEPFVVTKVGYLTPGSQARLSRAGIDPEHLEAISAESRYSLQEDVIRLELAASLDRLGKQRHDAVLLHNPEHLFGREVDSADPWSTMSKALELLEERVAAGQLGCYGISSNELLRNDFPRIEEWVKLAKSISANHHFEIVEFPFNFIENDRATRSGEQLADRVRALGLRSIGNRPLSTVRENVPVRFALYPDSEAADEAAFEACARLTAQRLSEIRAEHAVMDFPVMQFLRDSRRSIGHPDLVDSIFAAHVYPFVEHLWDAGSDGRDAFARLHATLRLQARRMLNFRAREIRAHLEENGVIDHNDSRAFSLIACEFVLEAGVDHCVVGMRTPSYVDSLSSLLQSPT